MRTKTPNPKEPAERVLKDIRRATRKHYSAEDKIRIVLEGLRGEYSIAELCRREGIAQSMYYGWSKEFLEAGKRRLAGDTARAATSDEVKDLRQETTALKEVVAEQALHALKAPPVRVARPSAPLAYAPTLEKAVTPDADKIVAANAEITLSLVSAEFDNNRVADGGGPFQGTKYVFTITP